MRKHVLRTPKFHNNMKIHPALQNFEPRKFGFKSGLEVHQQLYTEHKLFCHCPAGLYSDKYDAQVLRHMRPTLSELGEYDGTALMEFKTKKEIIYRLNKDSVCTYEMDDNPPFLINHQAVDIAIEIALMLNCSIVGELHVSRKQYLDGSIPAGFQRTAIVGVNGWIPYKGRKIGIIQLAVEEDACREVSDKGHRRVYATDRLSMPLIEVVTAPDMLEPQEVYEVGFLIGRILRITGKVRRGIGSVRQDVNVSIEGGTRVEIKGVPRLPIIPRLVHYEAYRQRKLLDLRELMKDRGLTYDGFESKCFEITGEFTPPVIGQDQSVMKAVKVGAIILHGMAGLLRHPIGSYRTFADDIAGRVRVIACMDHKPTMLHTDDGSTLIFTSRERERIRSLTNMGLEDCTVVVWGEERDVETALNEIEIRCKEVLTGIPNETRQVLSNGETTFERILPGPDRMYPDTDSPPLAIDRIDVEKIRSTLSERPWDRAKRLRGLGLSQHLVDVMLISPRISLFNKLVKEKKTAPVLTAYVLGELLIHIRRMKGNIEHLGDTELERLFDLYNSGRFCREAFRLVLEEYARTGETDWESVLARMEIISIKKTDVNYIIDEVLNESSNLGPDNPDAHLRFIIGLSMEQLRGRVPGHEVHVSLQEKRDDTG